MTPHFDFARYHAPTERQIAHSLDELAEHLSEDLPLPVIAERMHVTRGTAVVLYCQLCGLYGEDPQ